MTAFLRDTTPADLPGTGVRPACFPILFRKIARKIDFFVKYIDIL